MNSLQVNIILNGTTNIINAEFGYDVTICVVDEQGNSFDYEEIAQKIFNGEEFLVTESTSKTKMIFKTSKSGKGFKRVKIID